MDSPQSVVSPFKGESLFEKQNSNLFVESAGCLSRDSDDQRKETTPVLGVLEVFVHQASEIHNICIYHKQDVYAKVCLTSDPENAVSTKTINGGGQNPVFNDRVELNVGTIESSLKCEVYMLSRVKNYLEDQLLGFALVPISQVLANKGKLEKEFPLSSTELFHSPAGFVKLSLAYNGNSPDVFAIPNPASPDVFAISSVPSHFDKIEFPDPKIVDDNRLMISEYLGMPCPSSDSHIYSQSDIENHIEKVGAMIVESFSTCKIDSPRSSSVSLPLSTHSSDAANSLESATHLVGKTKEQNVDIGDVETDASGVLSSNTFIEPEPKVTQQDFVDMYMKSMQEFTNSLEQLKLPLDITSGPTSSGNSSSNQNSEATPKNSGSKVFYGSRAFF